MYKCSFLCALQLIDAKNTGQVNLVDVLDELSNATSGTDENSTLLIGDINVAVNTLKEIVDVVTVNTTHLENVTDVSTLNHSDTLLMTEHYITMVIDTFLQYHSVFFFQRNIIQRIVMGCLI
jgi:hypothetical protein